MLTKRILKVTRVIDLTNMPSGNTYEDRYGKYLDILKTIHSSKFVKVINPPWSWIPLIFWFGGDVDGGQCYFENDIYIYRMGLERVNIIKNRTLLEMTTCVRPELVDALWKSDMEWELKYELDFRDKRKEFVVTNNGSFHRKEVIDYFDKLKEFVPTKRKAILVPCAADKPYPSKLHKKVLDMMPEDYHIIIATGVLGLVPQELWPFMPHYDSGLPNEWRLMGMVESYFLNHHYEKVIVYCDYYNKAIQKGIIHVVPEVIFINSVKFYFNYLDLLDSERLDNLQTALLEDVI